MIAVQSLKIMPILEIHIKLCIKLITLFSIVESSQVCGLTIFPAKKLSSFKCAMHLKVVPSYKYVKIALLPKFSSASWHT